MSLQVCCPHCSTLVNVADEARGRKVRCGRCGEPFPIPDTAVLEPALAVHAGRCDACGAVGSTAYVTFHQHIGALVLMFHKHISGNLCRNCINKYFSEYTTTTLIMGWWGMISLFITPFVLLMNLVRYFSVGHLAAPIPGTAPAETPPTEAAAAARLSTPAALMIVTGIVGILWGGFGLWVKLFTAPPPNADPDQQTQMAFLWGAQFVCSLIIVAAGVQMNRLKTYWLAVTGCVLASIPLLAPCCVLSVPFGIWGLVVLLSSKEVRAAFARAGDPVS